MNDDSRKFRVLKNTSGPRPTLALELPTGTEVEMVNGRMTVRMPDTHWRRAARDVLSAYGDGEREMEPSALVERVRQALQDAVARKPDGYLPPPFRRCASAMHRIGDLVLAGSIVRFTLEWKPAGEADGSQTIHTDGGHLSVYFSTPHLGSSVILDLTAPEYRP